MPDPEEKKEIAGEAKMRTTNRDLEWWDQASLVVRFPKGEACCDHHGSLYAVPKQSPGIDHRQAEKTEGFAVGTRFPAPLNIASAQSQPKSPAP